MSFRARVEQLPRYEPHEEAHMYRERHGAWVKLADVLALLPAETAETPADSYAPFYLVALRHALEAIEKHDEWCGHKKDSPGNAVIWRAERTVGNAIRRLEAGSPDYRQAACPHGHDLTRVTCPHGCRQ
jgi:hypothetical protein